MDMLRKRNTLVYGKVYVRSAILIAVQQGRAVHWVLSPEYSTPIITFPAARAILTAEGIVAFNNGYTMAMDAAKAL